jgi:hypothetical protein
MDLRSSTAFGVALFVYAAALAFHAEAARAQGDSTGAGRARVGVPVAAMESLRLLGAENLSAGSQAPGVVGFENRRYPHLADMLGRFDRNFPASMVLVRRLGLAAATVALPPDTGSWPPRVRYPSDPGFHVDHPRRLENSTFRKLDLTVRPLFDYELGRLYDPVMVRTALQPELVANPWAGSRARLSWVFPLRNDFEVSELAPDVNRSRPGPNTLEQYLWLGRLGLASATGGLFSGNRYGLSVGLARPFAGGALLLDGQLDASGFWAWSDSGFVYSPLSRTTGYVGFTYRPPRYDLALRVHAARFLYGDQGVEAELERAMGNFTIAFFGQHSDSFNVAGVRLRIPIPPLVRPTSPRIRVLPPERIELEYRDVADPIGIAVADVASREEFLRQLSEPALAANRDRFVRASRSAADGVRPGAALRPSVEPVSWVGMTGFVTTPWCGVQPDQRLAMGYAKLPKRASWDHRGEHSNEVYYADLGLLPRVEIGLRWTVIPGLKTFEDIVPDSKLTDSDRMVSARLAVLEARGLRPGVAIGIEDATGTRRFHSTYAVAGIDVEHKPLQGRVALGYAPRVIDAGRYVLDGLFGGAEVAFRHRAAAALDHDLDRWNTALRLYPGFGCDVRAALFDLKHLGIGFGWSVAL